AVSARMKLAQHLELAVGRRWRFNDLRGEFDLPARVLLDLLAGDARVDRHHRHFFRLRIRLEQCQVGDELGRALGPYPELGAAVAAGHMADRRYEIELVDEAALALRHDDEDLSTRRGDFRGAAAARQADLRLLVRSDNGRVEICELVDL